MHISCSYSALHAKATVVATGLLNPVDFAFAPDGRIFICEKQGTVRVFKNGALLAAPFLDLIAEGMFFHHHLEWGIKYTQ